MRAITLGLLSLFALSAGAVATLRPERSAPPSGHAVVVALPPARQAEPPPVSRDLPGGATLADAPAAMVETIRAEATVADLPTREIPSRPVHVIREDALPAAAPPITVRGRDGRVITRLAARPPRAVMAPAAPSGGTPSAAPTAALSFTGAAQVRSGTTLAVAGRPVRLFGVRGPESRDRCVLGRNGPRSCAAVARDALAARLAGNPAVSCRVPPGQRGANPGAICRDSAGVDLGGFLVAEGFVLANPAQSYDYVGAEGVARSFRRGLWRYR